jgi:hypothetical protein
VYILFPGYSKNVESEQSKIQMRLLKKSGKVGAQAESEFDNLKSTILNFSNFSATVLCSILQIDLSRQQTVQFLFLPSLGVIILTNRKEFSLEF